jgi:hypothetical protein
MEMQNKTVLLFVMHLSRSPCSKNGETSYLLAMMVWAYSWHSISCVLPIAVLIYFSSGKKIIPSFSHAQPYIGSWKKIPQEKQPPGKKIPHLVK